MIFSLALAFFRIDFFIFELFLYQGKVNPTQCEALTMVCAQVIFIVLILVSQDYMIYWKIHQQIIVRCSKIGTIFVTYFRALKSFSYTASLFCSPLILTSFFCGWLYIICLNNYFLTSSTDQNLHNLAGHGESCGYNYRWIKWSF